MNQFVFILGHAPVLSSIEAKILIPDLSIQRLSGTTMVARSGACISLEAMEKSGGLVKIARHYAAAKTDDLAGMTVTALQELVPDGKITFGISVHGERGGIQGNTLAMQIKKILQEAGRAVRHVYSKEETLNSVTLLYNEFKKPGHVECVLLPRADDIIDLFITEAFQNVSEYTWLERLLQARDDRSGVLPLRLAKMLLNIAEVKNEHALLDPFCGSGMLVSVAAFRGVRSILASDVSTKAVQDTRNNLKNVIANKNVKLETEQRDIRELSKTIGPQNIDRIVTEPYLGPSNRMADQKEKEELSKLYVDSFQEFKKVLKRDGKIVFIFPVFESVSDFRQAQQEILQMGFHKVDLMKDVKQFFPGEFEPVYSRPQQRVKRLITVWELKK